jgi:hypothetical protein
LYRDNVTKLNCILDEEVGILLREVVEVESSAGWVPFVEENGGVLVFAVVVEKGNINARVL